MTISIHPATTEDAVGLHHAGEAAFADDALHIHSIKRPMTSSQQEAYLAWRVNRATERISNPNNHFYKAVDDETGTIVGGAGWIGPTDGQEKKAEPSSRYGKVPDCMDQAFMDELGERFKEARAKVLGEREDVWFLAALFVHPDYQGQGIASRLLKEGIEKWVDGDGRGLDAYLECSAAPSAKAVYLGKGFESVGDFSVLDGQYVIGSMLRKGRAKS